MEKHRPFGVTLLAILAGIAAVIAAFHTLQYLGLFPFFVGEINIPVRSFNLFAALMWGIMVWIYIWLVQMLWNVDKEGWLFLVVITIFNLILNFVELLFGMQWGDVAAATVVNAIILIYCMLPGVRKDFGE
jgi:hypothetical protein